MLCNMLQVSDVLRNYILMMHHQKWMKYHIMAKNSESGVTSLSHTTLGFCLGWKGQCICYVTRGRGGEGRVG